MGMDDPPLSVAVLFLILKAYHHLHLRRDSRAYPDVSRYKSPEG